MDPLIQSSTTIVVPVVGRPPQLIDLSQIYDIEKRVEEVAFVTPAKAPELMTRFNEAFLFVHKTVSLLEYEYVQAEREANKIRSVVLLDRAPAILEAKGLLNGRSRAGSEDQRKAILDADEQYQEALDRAEKIKCIIELLRGKLKGFEMAYNSVKKILGESPYKMINRNLSGGAGDTPVGAVNRDTVRVEGFGQARYDDERNR